MDRKVALRVAVLVGAAGVIALLVVNERKQQARADARAEMSARPDLHAESSHAKGIDWALAPLTAPFDAPDGGTPCETAYLAMKAAQDVAAANGRPPVLLFLAENDDFIARCSELPPEAQTCMQPRYIARHREECARVRPPQATLDKMFRAHAEKTPE